MGGRRKASKRFLGLSMQTFQLHVVPAVGSLLAPALRRWRRGSGIGAARSCAAWPVAGQHDLAR